METPVTATAAIANVGDAVAVSSAANTGGTGPGTASAAVASAADAKDGAAVANVAHSVGFVRKNAIVGTLFLWAKRGHVSPKTMADGTAVGLWMGESAAGKIGKGVVGAAPGGVDARQQQQQQQPQPQQEAPRGKDSTAVSVSAEEAVERQSLWEACVGVADHGQRLVVPARTDGSMSDAPISDEDWNRAAVNVVGPTRTQAHFSVWYIAASLVGRITSAARGQSDGLHVVMDALPSSLMHKLTVDAQDLVEGVLPAATVACDAYAAGKVKSVRAFVAVGAKALGPLLEEIRGSRVLASSFVDLYNDLGYQRKVAELCAAHPASDVKGCLRKCVRELVVSKSRGALRQGAAGRAIVDTFYPALPSSIETEVAAVCKQITGGTMTPTDGAAVLITASWAAGLPPAESRGPCMDLVAAAERCTIDDDVTREDRAASTATLFVEACKTFAIKAHFKGVAAAVRFLVNREKLTLETRTSLRPVLTPKASQGGQQGAAADAVKTGDEKYWQGGKSGKGKGKKNKKGRYGDEEEQQQPRPTGRSDTFTHVVDRFSFSNKIGVSRVLTELVKLLMERVTVVSGQQGATNIWATAATLLGEGDAEADKPHFFDRDSRKHVNQRGFCAALGHVASQEVNTLRRRIELAQSALSARAGAASKKGEKNQGMPGPEASLSESYAKLRAHSFGVNLAVRAMPDVVALCKVTWGRRVIRWISVVDAALWPGISPVHELEVSRLAQRLVSSLAVYGPGLVIMPALVGGFADALAPYMVAETVKFLDVHASGAQVVQRWTRLEASETEKEHMLRIAPLDTVYFAAIPSLFPAIDEWNVSRSQRGDDES